MTAEPPRPPGALTAGPISWIARRIRHGTALVTGCADPSLVEALAGKGVRVTAFDANEAAVDATRDQLVRAGTGATVEHVEASEWPYPAGSFDAVVLDRVLEHALAPGHLVEEARKALNDEGTLVVVARYGLHAHDDHADALYLGRLAELLGGVFAIEGADLDGTHALIAAHPGARAHNHAMLLAVAERRLGTIDVDLLEAHRATEKERERADRLDRSVRMMQSSRAWRIAKALRRFRGTR